MNIRRYTGAISQAIALDNGPQLVKLLSIDDTTSIAISTTSNQHQIERQCQHEVPPAWEGVVTNHLQAARFLQEKNYTDAYASQLACCQAFLRIFTTQTNWCLPVLYVVNKNLRDVAIMADKQLLLRHQKAGKLEDAARLINKSFTACITDRNSGIQSSRKWGTYRIINLLFSTYFNLKSHGLCENILRAVKASDLPSLERYPKSHQVGYRYYLGRLAFMKEDYKKAEEEFMFAFKRCPRYSRKNKGIILTYLVPSLLARGVLPAPKLFLMFSNIKSLYEPFVRAIKVGNLKHFDEALSRLEKPLVQKGVYSTIERTRGIVIRTLFKKVYLLTNRNSRLPFNVLQTALVFVGIELELAEVECLLANMIFKGYIKGYMSHDKGFLVLSKDDAFPKFSTISLA
ncbi:COP9 signalosome (CSN) subunit [Basidiobolus ranarum]|uniref:COP9 signalosome (CSN) subunit n=1 Tax=Basidiobolus ranarum TaxID=34480 RepID=A0ABR2WR07_9FUNG